MKKMLLTLTLISLSACATHEKKAQVVQKTTRMVHKTGQKVHVYKTPVSSGASSSGDITWLYWYILMDSGNNRNYSVSSSTPITDFSSAKWSSSPGNLPKEFEKSKAIEEPEEEIAEKEVPEELETEETPSEAAGKTTETETEETTETDSSNDSPGDSTASDSNSDSGSADSGSGDSGSGDSGGGGGE